MILIKPDLSLDGAPSEGCFLGHLESAFGVEIGKAVRCLEHVDYWEFEVNFYLILKAEPKGLHHHDLLNLGSVDALNRYLQFKLFVQTVLVHICRDDLYVCV